MHFCIYYTLFFSFLSLNQLTDADGVIHPAPHRPVIVVTLVLIPCTHVIFKVA